MGNRDESALKKLDLFSCQNGQTFDLRTVKFPLRSQKQPKISACGGLHSFLSEKSVYYSVLVEKTPPEGRRKFLGVKNLTYLKK